MTPTLTAVEPTTVYRCYDADGTVIYIGMTRNLGARVGTHKSASPWWSQVTSISRVVYPTRRDAYEAEQAAITAERPTKNVRPWHGPTGRNCAGINMDPAALRTIRERSGLSVTALATAAGIKQSHLSNIEAGRRRASAEVAVALARALKVDLLAIVADPKQAAS